MLSATFTAFLKAERGALNQAVLEARRRHPAFDTDAFGRFLQRCVDPLVACAPPSDAHAVAMAGYELALELCGSGYAGARSAALPLAWTEVAVAMCALTAREPARVLAMLSNAVIHLEAQGDVRVAQWIEEMTALAPSITSCAELEAVGQVAAWRAGMAHFRAGAIAASDGLPSALACAAVGAPAGSDWQQVRAALAANPWASFGEPARKDRVVGHFEGFGGSFMVPPTIRAQDNGFVVRSADRYFFLMADAFGAVLQPATAEDFNQAPAVSTGGWSLRGSTLLGHGRSIAVGLPSDGLALCCNGHTLALVSPFTHAIQLFASA